MTVFDHYCHAVSSPSAEIERRPPATQLFNINRTSRVFFYTFEELRCGPPGAQSVRVSRNHRFLCRRPAPLGLPSSPLAIQCPYIKSAPWPASAPWPSNAPLIRSTLSGYGAITGYSALLVSVPLHVTVPLQVTVPQTISVFFQVTVPPARLRCSFWCQYPFWYLIPLMVSPRTHAHTFN